MVNNKDFLKTFFKVCKSAKKIAISGHRNPDYDCLCSSLAVQQILKQNGIDSDVLLEVPLGAGYAPFIKNNSFVTQDFGNYDVFISVDTPEKKMIPSNIVPVCDGAKFTFSIDHHQGKAPFIENTFVVPGESSACEVIYTLFKNYFRLNTCLASVFYIGVYADTGGFIYSNTHSTTFTILAELLDANIKADELVEECFTQISRPAYELNRIANDSVKFYADGQIAVSTITLKDFEKTKASYADGKLISAQIQHIEGVKVAICFFEQTANNFSVSLRTACDNVNVANIASQFNGGGHIRASGLKLYGEYKKVLNAILHQTKLELGIK